MMQHVATAQGSTTQHACASFAAGIFPDPVVLASFSSQSDVSKWKVFSDAAFGGKSTAALELGAEGKVGVSMSGQRWGGEQTRTSCMRVCCWLLGFQSDPHG